MAGISRHIARKVGLYFLVDPSGLVTLDDWAEWLLSLRSGLCDVVVDGDSLVLVEVRRRVDVVDGRLKIEIYSDEHAPPHFHVKSPSVDATFAIDDCAFLGGNATEGDIRIVRYWHQHAKPTLIRVWNTTRPGDCSVGEYVHA